MLTPARAFEWTMTQSRDAIRKLREGEDMRRLTYWLTVAIVGAGIALPMARAVDPTQEPSVVLYFSFDEGEGVSAEDLSGNGNTGSIENATWVEGRHGMALEFNGDDTWVEVAADSSLDLQLGMTTAAWFFKTENLAANQGETLLSKKQGGAYCLEVSGWENRSLNKLSTENRISGVYHPVFSEDDVPLGEWVHAAATYDETNVRLYMNGALVGEEEWPGAIDVNTAKLFVGAESDDQQPDATHGRFFGLIDEVVIANRAFSEAEIGELMETGLAVDGRDKLPIVWGRLRVE